MRASLLLLAAAAALLCQTTSAQHMMMPGMGDAIKPSQNMADPCYKDPSVEGCRSFRRDHMDIVADRDSLCAAMDFMVGCTLSHECTNGTTTANSTYCKPWSLVGDLCIDMPGMNGCEAWNALCGKGVANVTVVDMCKDPAPVPDVLTTMDAKDAVVAICTAEPTLDGCATCDFTLPGYSVCKDYLTTLSLLCQEVPENDKCSGLRDMCGGERVAQAFPDLCAFL